MVLIYRINIAAADQATDTPTNNFATALMHLVSHRPAIFTKGVTTTTILLNTLAIFSTIGVTSGKWYWEL